MNALTREERLVAELEYLGVGYLSRQTFYHTNRVRSPNHLLSNLIQQPNSRIRTAVIAVLLSHPEYAQSVPASLRKLKSEDQLTFKLFYTASTLLQKIYASRLKPFLAERWQWLPDLFSEEFNFQANQDPEDQLKRLGEIHQQKLGCHVNWYGSYRHAAEHLLHRWELERQWSR